MENFAHNFFNALKIKFRHLDFKQILNPDKINLVSNALLRIHDKQRLHTKSANKSYVKWKPQRDENESRYGHI